MLNAHELSLVPITTPAYSPENNGLAEAFVGTFKRDYIAGAELRDAEAVLAQLAAGSRTTTIAHGIGLGRIASVIHSYPTQAEAIRKLGDAYNRTRLTPLVKRVFGAWLAFSRR